MIEDDKTLVERLRGYSKVIETGVHEDCDTAADRIEALIAENERLKYSGIHSCHDECERPLCVAQRENERLQAQYDEMGNTMLKHIGNSAAEIVRLELENERLRADAERLLSEEPIATCEGCGAYLFDGDDYFTDPDGIEGCWAMTNTPSKRERPCYSYRVGETE